MNVLSKLNNCLEKNGAGFIILIDPDKKNNTKINKIVEIANIHADAIFVGGSIMMDSLYHDRVRQIKSMSEIPVILFPGGVNQLNDNFDAMLFMSLFSGRNPHYLIGEQVIAAPIVKDYGIETIPTGYLLIDCGSPTTVEFVSGTRPLSPNRPDVILSHALAAQYLGVRLIYLEAGSGAKNKIPGRLINQVASEIDIDLIVGGGIRTPQEAKNCVDAGASYVVIGSAIENSVEVASEFSSAIHKN